MRNHDLFWRYVRTRFNEKFRTVNALIWIWVINMYLRVETGKAHLKAGEGGRRRAPAKSPQTKGNASQSSARRAIVQTSVPLQACMQLVIWLLELRANELSMFCPVDNNIVRMDWSVASSSDECRTLGNRWKLFSFLNASWWVRKVLDTYHAQTLA